MIIYFFAFLDVEFNLVINFFARQTLSKSGSQGNMNFRWLLLLFTTIYLVMGVDMFSCYGRKYVVMTREHILFVIGQLFSGLLTVL